MYVKAGQHLASLKPGIPAVYADTLSVLQDAAPARAFEEVVATVERELGKKLHEVFATFDPAPVGRASPFTRRSLCAALHHCTCA